jgi:hypothetical protein
MKRFILKLFCVLFPLFIFIGVMEAVIRHIPNDYSIKNEVMATRGKDLKVLFLGNSQTYYGVDPQYIDMPAYNCAHVSQQLHVDNFIFNKFIDSLDSLEYLFLNISYFSHLQSFFDGQEAWRAKYYYLYYDYPKKDIPFKYQFEFYNLNFSSLTNIMKGLAGKPLYHIDNNGFGTKYRLEKKPTDWEDCEFIARLVHTITPDSEILKHNYECLENISIKCKKRGIRLILFTTPCWHTYTEIVDSAQLSSSVEFAKHFAEKYENVDYQNYFTDNRFVADDFYDAYHLSNIGAKKMTLILNDYIKTQNTK